LVGWQWQIFVLGILYSDVVRGLSMLLEKFLGSRQLGAIGDIGGGGHGDQVARYGASDSEIETVR
jgi:ABC-type methionine transport system permease subunit